MNILKIAPSILILLSCKATAPTPVPSAASGMVAQSKSHDSIDRKVDSLLAIMTLDEKIGQMTLYTSEWGTTGPTLRPSYKDDIRKGRVGAIFNALSADYTRDLQRLAVEETRLKIPLMFGYDVIHGYKTIFPIPLGGAASWDLAAIERSARIAAEEATSAGLHWTFAPMVDIARDPRWGRIAEGAGEDTYLGSQIAAAQVRGFQGKDLRATNTLLACAKHFAAYGAAQAGRDYHTVDMSEVTLREVYLPPFKAALDAGAATFMTAFNEINGVPASANQLILDQILRKEWGFQGFVVTDYTSINEMVPHGYASDEKHASELSANAGVDMDMMSAAFYNHLTTLIAEGKVSVATIDQAVRRILRKKYELGLFDDPYRYCDAEREKRTLLSPANLEAARDMARKSMVLLQNTGNVLPLSRLTGTVAVIGPLADNKPDLLGSWHGAGDASHAVTLLEGIRQKVGPSTKVLYAKGCDFSSITPQELRQASEIARQADVVILAVGEQETMSGEAACRTDLRLPGQQEALVSAMIASGKPIVVVLMNGRPLVLGSLVDNANAILEAWFPGTMGGLAIADVLFGDYNPSGKLPVTFPRSVGQIPIFYNQKNTGRPMDIDPNGKYTSKYLDVPNTPQFPFGFGLSYTDFAYSQLQVSYPAWKMQDSLVVTVNVRNIGKYDGEEVVQLYVRDLVGSTTRPVRELKGWQKIALKKDESKDVRFVLRANDLRFVHPDLRFEAEPGEFEIFVGGSSQTHHSRRVLLMN